MEIIFLATSSVLTKVQKRKRKLDTESCTKLSTQEGSGKRIRHQKIGNQNSVETHFRDSVHMTGKFIRKW